MTETHRFAAAWYVHAFLRELVLVYPSYAIMMGGHGISPLALSTLFVLWTATALVLEVPSGVLADRVSRKWLLCVSGVLKGSAFAAWLVFPGYAGFAVGFVLWGTASSLASGTAEAFLYDTLRARGQADAFGRIYGRGVACNSLGVASALLIGGQLAESGFTTPLALSILAPWAAAMVIAIACSDPPRGRPTAEEPFHATLAAGLAAVRDDATLRTLVAAIAALATIYGTLEEYIGPYLTEKPQFALGTVGLVYAIAFGARAAGVAFADRVRLETPRAIAALYAASALPLAATLVGGPAAVAIAFALYFAVCAVAEVRLQTALQHRFDGHARATVTSVAGMGQHLTGIVLYLAIGSVAEAWTWHVAVAATALLTAALAGAFALAAPRAPTNDGP